MSQGPPLRLRDDPAVARALREDLARSAANPGAAYDVAAGAARFEQALRTGAGASAGAGVGAKTALGAAIKGALLGAAVIGGAAALGDRAPAPVAAPPPPAVSVVRATPTIDEGSSPTPLPPSPPPSAPVKVPVVQTPNRDREELKTPSYPPAQPVTSAPRPQIANLAEPPPTAVPSAVVSAAPRDPEPAAPPSSGGALAAELEHLARLRAGQNGDPAQVLALAVEGNQRFPSGLFAQEREAIAIDALARLGRLAEARARARAFLASYPRSAFAERIKKRTGIVDDP